MHRIVHASNSFENQAQDWLAFDVLKILPCSSVGHTTKIIFHGNMFQRKKNIKQMLLFRIPKDIHDALPDLRKKNINQTAVRNAQCT